MAQPTFDRFGKPVDPLDPRTLRRENRALLFADILRNAAGIPEAALSLGTGLADMAGTGLGTLAGMAKQKLSGEDVDLDAAVDTVQEGKFTYAPRSEPGKEFARGLGTVMEPIERGMQWAGQGTADVSGSPALGAAVYTGLNMLDPQMFGPAAAKVAALRGASTFARNANTPPVKRKGSIYSRQEGAWSPADIADVEGNFEFYSPSLKAFDRLKPQESGRVTGRQLRAALMREGAKKEELTGMGLDDLLDSNEVLSVADVRRVAEANQPDIQSRTLRSGETELDEEAISEAAYERAMEDDDLEYPIGVYRGSGRHRELLDTVDNERQARARIEEYKESDIESEVEYYLENIAEHFDEEELAAMTDEQKREWAQSSAESSVEDSDNYSYEPDYDSEPINLDSLREYWEDEIRRSPGDYGIAGGSRSAPSYGEYTVAKAGRDPEANYSVSGVTLAGEGRFGRGTRQETPDFLEPYMQEDTASVLEEGGQTSLFPEAQRSKAFQIEALRRKKLADDPHLDKYRQPFEDSHYGELGSNQMVFTRETDHPAPSWGSVQRGVGALPESNLLDATNAPLPQSTLPERPLRFLEEVQSDWYQRGRKTGWAEPKHIEKTLRETADEAARVDALKRQTLGELPLALERPEVAEFIQQAVARASLPEAGYYDILIRDNLDSFQQQLNDPNIPVDDKIATAHTLFSTLYNAAPADHPVERFASDIREGLNLLPTVQESPLSKITASGPMRETPQYTRLGIMDALRRAVQEGQQYVGFTPGDVHTKRWGSDTVQFAADPSNPRLVRWVSENVASVPGAPGMEQLQKRAQQLLDDGAHYTTIDLDAPDLDKQLFDIVRNYLDYGMHEYPNPNLQRKKRAKTLRKEMEAASAAAAQGTPTAAHYSPRASGNEVAYGPIEQMYAEILRNAGSKAEIRPLTELSGADPKLSGSPPLKGFEIDPELARAVKRGLPLPY